MILIGRGIRWYRPYAEEVQFCVENQFDFMQIWYRDGELLIPRGQTILRSGDQLVCVTLDAALHTVVREWRLPNI